jgi:hypothetical protein
LTIQISYAYDTTGFLANNPTARATLQLAANDIASQLTTSLAALTPGGSNTWAESFFNPETGQQVTVNNPSVAANTIVVYAGGRVLGSNQVSMGAFGGYSLSGSQAWIDTITGRSPGWGNALWGGSIAFDTTTNWYYGAAASGLGSNQVDFFTCATHELAHVLGLGTASKWYSQITNNAFTGPHSEAIYGGPIPVTWGAGGELADVTVKGVQPVMDLDLKVGVRLAPFTSLDWALMQDIGWSVTPPSPPVAPPPAAPPPAPPPTVPPPPPPPVTSVPVAAPANPVLVSGGNGLVYLYAENSSGVLQSTGQTFRPFPGYTGAIRTTVADFNGDHVPDYAFTTASGTSAKVVIIDGATGANIIPTTQVLGGFTGGAFLAAGDLNRNGKAELVVSADAGGLPTVQVFQVASGRLSLVTSFMPINPAARCGVHIAMGDINRDGIPDLVISAGAGWVPVVRIFDGAALAKGQTVLLTPAFLAFGGNYTGGVNVAVGDVNGDGYGDLIVSQDSGGTPLVRVWSGAVIRANPTTAVSSLPTFQQFYANGTSGGGIRITTRDLYGNGIYELVTAPATGSGNWLRVLTVSGTAVTPQAALFPFGSGTLLDGVFVG